MATTYEFTNPGNTTAWRSSDGAFIAWSPAQNKPSDQGLALRTWIADGSPAPAVYNPAKWPN